MFDKNKVLIIIATILLIILIIGVSVLFIVARGLKRESNDLSKYVSEVDNTYRAFEGNIDSFNYIRNSITGNNSYSVDNFNDGYSTLYNSFTSYDNVITSLKINVSKLDRLCNSKIYSSKNLDECDNYKSLYKQMIDIYNDDVNNFNLAIKNYNEETSSSLKLFEGSNS